MAYSSLVNFIQESPNKYTRGRKIDSIAIHCVGSNLSIRSIGQRFSDKSVNASSNYGVDSNGNIGMFVDESYRSMCTSNRVVDDRCITIEVSSIQTKAPYTISDAALQALEYLIVDVCRRNKISSISWRNDKQYALNASNGGSVASQNIFIHRWFKNTWCPGDYIISKLPVIVSDVNTMLAKNTKLPSSSGVTGGKYSVSSKIDATELMPYVVTISRDSLVYSGDYFRSKGVVGGVVEAGYLYDTRHNSVKFRNPNAEGQVSELIKSSIAYGWYMISRARSATEAKLEVKELAYLIRTYPPGIGVWIQPDMTHNAKTLNTAIFNTLRDELVRLGLKGKIGIYTDYSRLKSDLNWDSLKQDWMLWSVDHVQNTDELDDLLQPEFFSSEGRY